MGEWSDREYEMGFVDNEGNILVNDDDITSSNEIIVELTPHKYLSSREWEHRLDLDHQYDTRHCMSLKHARYNTHDNKALAVYYFNESKDVFVGHVRKNPIDKNFSNSDAIEMFCFSEGVTNNISIQKRNGDYVINRRFEDKREDSLNDHKNVDTLLFRDKKVQQQVSEIETIEHAIKNRDAYSLTNYEVEFLESSLTSAKLDHIGKTGKKLASDSVSAVENIVVGAIDVGIGIFNLFKSKKKVIMKSIKIYILVFSLLPQIVLASSNWQVIDTTGSEEPGDPAYICVVMPIKFTGSDIIFKDMMVMHRRGNSHPMVTFAPFDQGAYSFKYVIDHPSIPEQVQEVLPDRKGSLFINGPKAVSFIKQLKKGNRIRYLISSPNKKYETRAVSLVGFTKTFDSINSCKE